MDVVAMPQLGETVTEGTILSWAVEVGDRVEFDDTLFEVSTEKIDTEVPSAFAGYVRALLVDVGQAVPIGTPVVALTATADEEFDLAEIQTVEAETGEARKEVSLPAQPTARPTGVGDVETDRSPVTLSPVVRRLLAEHRLEAASVVGSGRDGRITRADVLAAAAQQRSAPLGMARTPAGQPSPVGTASTRPVPSEPSVPGQDPSMSISDEDTVIDFSRARAATAVHMVRSLATSAHALVVVEVDYHAIEPVRKAAGLSYLPFVARAVIEAIRDFPHVNASVDGTRLVIRPRINLGFAVDVDREALVVPVLHDADQFRLPALGAAVVDLADRARRHRLSGAELAGGTFTLTNVGSYGTVVSLPIINQPQVAIVSTDGVRMAPVAVQTAPVGENTAATPKEWGVAVHPVGNLCLSFDHRAFDGAYAAAFLAQVRDLLQTRPWVEEL